MIITTTNSIESQVITQYLGLVNANQVIGTNFFSDLTASLSDVFGGMSGTYREKMNELYRDVLNELESRASSIGADAIIGLSVDFDEISGKGKSMFMVSAVGTAVKLGIDRLAMARSLHELQTYHDADILTDDEYNFECSRVKGAFTNQIATEVNAVKEEERQRQQQEAIMQETLAKQAAEQQKQLLKEQEQKMNAEQLRKDVEEKIEKEFLAHRSDVEAMTTTEIQSATYEGKIPDADLKIYEVIRYLVASGEAAAAGKYYVDKYHLSPEDAKEYILGIFNALA